MSEALDNNMNDGRPRVTHRPLHPGHSSAVTDRPPRDGKSDSDRLLDQLFKAHGHELKWRSR